MPRYEDVKKLFDEAIGRSLKTWTAEEKRRVMGLVDKTIQNLREGRIDWEEAYYQLIGIAYRNLVPLSPGDISRLKEMLK
jgi:hypothetical protein